MRKSAARRHFENAWELNSRSPVAPSRIIAVIREEGYDSLDEVRMWFDRSVSARLDYYPVYTQLRLAMQTAPFNTYEAMGSMARECLATDRYDTIVPFMAFDFYVPVAPIDKLPFELLDRPGLFDDLHTMATNYLAEPSMEPRHKWMRSFLIALSWRCQRWEEGARAVADAGALLSEAPFRRLGVYPANAMGEILFRTGASAQQVRRVEELAAAGNFDAALELFKSLESTSSGDERVDAFLQRKLTDLQWEAKWNAGEWVDILPRDDLHNWIPLHGKWSITARRTLLGESQEDGLLLVCAQPFGRHYELEGKVRFAGSQYQGTNAGVFLPQQGGQYGNVIAYPHVTHFRFFRENPRALYYFRRQNVARAVEVPEENVFRIVRHFDKVNAYLNDGLLYDMAPVNASGPIEKDLVAIGGVFWYDGSQLEFSELRIRRLEPTDEGPDGLEPARESVDSPGN